MNVLSPGGISRINKLNRVKLQEKVIDFIEGVVNSKELSLSRKTQFRQLIDEADHD